MQILWHRERAFVREIMEDLPEPKPPVTTVSSIVRKLEGQGCIGHEDFGKTYRYFPVLRKEDYRKVSFQQLLEDYFGGSPKQLLSFFMKEEQADPDELASILKEIQDREGK